jgi:hypothetical protein
MELIRKWYNGSRNYAVGVQLYLQYGDDPALKAFFRNDHTPFREQKLAEELKALLLGDPPHVSEEQAGHSFPRNNGSSDPIVEELFRQKSALHKEKDLLRHNLKHYPNDTERGVAAHQILKLRKQITAIWAKEQYYQQHGRLPEDDAGITDPAMLKHRRHIVNGNIRRLKSLLKQKGENASYRASLVKFEAEYAELKEKINKFKHLINEQTTRG